jgi:hypothetical protein
MLRESDIFAGENENPRNVHKILQRIHGIRVWQSKFSSAWTNFRVLQWERSLMAGFGRKVTAAAVAMSLCAVPTVAIGATPSASGAPAAVSATSSSWLTLSAMTSSSSAATAAAAAQGDGDGSGFPPIAPLVVILATIAAAVYILVKDDDGGHVNLPIPVSPA